MCFTKYNKQTTHFCQDIMSKVILKHVELFIIYGKWKLQVIAKDEYHIFYALQKKIKLV